MKKLRLELNGLKVESFDTFVAEDRRGTVRANAQCETYSCGGTCGATPPPTSTLTTADLWAASQRTNCAQCCV